MSDYRGWITLREIDARLGQSKGTAFRRFKQLEPALREGADFVVLDAQRDRAQIDALRAQQRIYASSINVILLSPSSAQRLAAAAQ
ncbi:MAG TPA: hypothetical protein VHE37_15325 [Nevskiaceae bacterium]|nr:hypothetical protein [Nevskiaceae bacterium]